MQLPNRKQWIGERQIDTAEFMAGMHDANGSELVKVTFIQGGIEYFTQTMLPLIVTDKSVSSSDLRDLRCNPAAQAILKVYADYGIKMLGEGSEVNYITRIIAGTLEERFKQASAFLWGVYEDQITAIDLAAVLTKQAEVMKIADERKKQQGN